MSCLVNQCVNGGKCTTRFNGNYSCQCSSPYSGIYCQNGILFFFFGFKESHPTPDWPHKSFPIFQFKVPLDIKEL